MWCNSYENIGYLYKFASNTLIYNPYHVGG